MSRDLRLYLEDIREHCGEILADTDGLTLDQFVADRRTYKAVVYSLQVVGEAAKHVPPTVRARYSELEWSSIAGMRDVLAHGYFALDDRIVWDAARSHVPLLREQIERILTELE